MNVKFHHPVILQQCKYHAFAHSCCRKFHEVCYRCENTEGSFICHCPIGLVGDPITTGCKQPGACINNEDCPLAAACIDNNCRNPCDQINICGVNAECISENRQAICKCPIRTTGDPLKSCAAVECEDSGDCSDNEACVNYKCINPCLLENVCGSNADCSASNHIGVCTCQAGHTGDARLGCISVQYCATDSQCPSGTSCYNGICTCKFFPETSIHPNVYM